MYFDLGFWGAGNCQCRFYTERDDAGRITWEPEALPDKISMQQLRTESASFPAHTSGRDGLHPKAIGILSDDALEDPDCDSVVYDDGDDEDYYDDGDDDDHDEDVVMVVVLGLLAMMRKRSNNTKRTC